MLGHQFPVCNNVVKFQISQGYIIRILQHFATKLWYITNFVMLFQAVMKFCLDQNLVYNANGPLLLSPHSFSLWQNLFTRVYIRLHNATVRACSYELGCRTGVFFSAQYSNRPGMRLPEKYKEFSLRAKAFRHRRHTGLTSIKLIK